MLLIAAMNVPSMVFLGAALLVSGILLFQSNRYFSRLARRQSFSDTLREQPEPEPPPATPGVSHNAERWEVEMHDLARELSARLDSKMGALQQLIRDADRAAARLERASRRTGAGADAAATPPASIDLATLGAGDSAASETSGAAAGYQQRYEEIYMLADYGHPPEEIAQRVGSPIGEVQLILGLRKKH